MAKAAVERMVPRGGGVIFNMASIASLIGVPDRFAYSVTKGAILTMTYSIAIDYVKKGIRCNCIAPGAHPHALRRWLREEELSRARRRRPAEAQRVPAGRPHGPPRRGRDAGAVPGLGRSVLHHRPVLPDRRRRVGDLTPKREAEAPMKRLGATIGLKRECLEEYKRIHVKLWPEIEGAIKAAGIEQLLDFLQRRPAVRVLRTPGPGAGLRRGHGAPGRPHRACVNGGASPSLCRCHAQTASQGTGGPPWKRSSTSTEAPSRRRFGDLRPTLRRRLLRYQWRT